MVEKKPRILVVGSINMDLVLEMDRLPEGGETLLGRRYSYIPGGKGANQAVAAARLGAEVTFVGRVGRDDHGSALREHLAREAVDSELLAVDEAAQTGFAVIPVEESGAFLYETAAGCGQRVAGFSVKAVDTTAAGDAFTAGLAAQYLRTGELPRAVRYANAAGALAVTRLGAQPSMPHRAEVESFLLERGLEP